MAATVFQYELVLGMPHTNHAGFAEHALLKYGAHFHWNSIAATVGRPISTLRLASGEPVYAAVSFVDLRMPTRASLRGFKSDDRLRVLVFLRTLKGIVVEGRLVFDLHDRLPSLGGIVEEEAIEGLQRAHPTLRLATTFITPASGNSRLRLAAPADADFSSLPRMADEDNPHTLTKSGERTGRLDVLDERWLSIDSADDFSVTSSIDPDRDSNGAGLVYFANYASFLDFSERSALSANSRRRFSEHEILNRTTVHRRIAYYANAALTDQVRIRPQVFEHPEHPDLIAFRCHVTRRTDERLICLAETIKRLPS